ncbi:MAG: M24 family metallopeptidase [Planctomycetes bacterium]|nr:M24 family metallopeptidase [Planctomycetota bacterium]
MTTGREAEVRTKLARSGEFLAGEGLDALVLRRRGPLAWILDGADSHVRADSEDACAFFAVLRDGTGILAADAIEMPRLRAEELGDVPVAPLVHPWTTNGLEALLAELARRRAGRIASESLLPGVDPLGADAAARFQALRLVLTPVERERLRALGLSAASALEAAARGVRPGQSEHEIAGALEHNVRATGARAVVALVAGDQRIERFRHPIPTGQRVTRRAMLVLCAERHGLVVSATRLVGFQPLSGEVARRARAVAEVDAAALAATRPGARLADVFAAIQHAYAEQGFPDEWRFHHQGGIAGYAPREVVATPTSPQLVAAGQAFAWNPSITGTKSEDTILLGDAGVQVVTWTGTWPAHATAAGPRPAEATLEP